MVKSFESAFDVLPSNGLSEKPGAYTSWEQVSGYFDGDGTPALTITNFTIVPSLDWADSFRPQLEAVRSFLLGQELKPTNSYPCGGPKPVWHLRLSVKGGLTKAAQAMLPHLVKKRAQIKAVIDYLQDGIYGETLVEIFNEATRLGTRSGFIRQVTMPFIHTAGILHARDIVHKGKRVSNILTEHVLGEIQERRNQGEILRDISMYYGVSRSAIRRAILRQDSDKLSAKKQEG